MKPRTSRSSNVMLLAWHEECLRNARRSLADREASAARLAEEIARLRAEAEHHALQIEEATRRGLQGFDRDRLLKSRWPKASWPPRDWEKPNG